MDKEISQDIVDIFIEEVADVQLLIEQHLPAWQQHGDDKLALQEIRRAFHTLKGSGKMVGAEMLAKLGFVFEDALNQVIEGLRPVSQQLQQLVAKSLELLPDLLQDFVDKVDAHDNQAQKLIDALAGAKHSQAMQPELAQALPNIEAAQTEHDGLLERLDQLEIQLQQVQQKLRFYWLTPALCGLMLLAIVVQYFV